MPEAQVQMNSATFLFCSRGPVGRVGESYATNTLRTAKRLQLRQLKP